MSSFDDEVDEFDFGGDELEEEKAPQGTKRGFDLLEEEDEEELYPAKKPTLTGEDHATTTILNLRASLDEKEASISSLEAKLSAISKELDSWRGTFKEGVLPTAGAPPGPAAVLGVVKQLQAADGRLREQVRAVKKRENVMLLKLSAKDQEVADLKAHILDMREMLKPPYLESRRLLLDPVIHAEFMHLKEQAEAAEKRARALQDDLAAVQFTPHSKHGKMLMAKCKTLQEENEEIGQQASEGKIHELENKVALQKQLNAELKRGYTELQEYVDDMNEEAEKLQSTVYALQRQVKQRDREIHDLRQRIPEKQPRQQGQGAMETSREAHGRVEHGKDDGKADYRT